MKNLLDKIAVYVEYFRSKSNTYEQIHMESAPAKLHRNIRMTVDSKACSTISPLQCNRICIHFLTGNSGHRKDNESPSTARGDFPAQNG